MSDIAIEETFERVKNYLKECKKENLDCGCSLTLIKTRNPKRKWALGYACSYNSEVVNESMLLTNRIIMKNVDPENIKIEDFTKK